MKIFLISFFISLFLVAIVSAADTYTKKKIFTFSSSEYGPPTDYAVDDHQNLYLLDQDESVRIYGQNGKKIGGFQLQSLNGIRANINVDELGRILVCPIGGYDFWIYAQNGELLKTGKFKHLRNAFERINFRKGKIYSEVDGGILYQDDGSNENSASLEQPDFSGNYEIKRSVQNRPLGLWKKNGSAASSLPNAIDGYELSDVICVDCAGDIYVLYQTEPQGLIPHHFDNTKYYPRNFKTYKFDKNLNQTFVFPFKVVVINKGTQNVYSFEVNGDGNIDFVVWEYKK